MKDGHGERVLMAAVMALVLAGGFEAQAADPQEVGLDVGFDVEVDPLAYAVGGHSLHVGIWLDRVRVDLGVFGLDVPELVHGNEGFEVSFAGFGSKADIFFDDDRSGWFVGVEGGVSKVVIARPSEGLAQRHTQANLGGRAGYRWAFAGGFYAEPWLGVGYAFGARDLVLGGERFENNPLTIFPTIHLGYQID